MVIDYCKYCFCSSPSCHLPSCLYSFHSCLYFLILQQDFITVSTTHTQEYSYVISSHTKLQVGCKWLENKYSAVSSPQHSCCCVIQKVEHNILLLLFTCRFHSTSEPVPLKLVVYMHTCRKVLLHFWIISSELLHSPPCLLAHSC